MTPAADERRRVDALLQAALDLPAEERAAFLDRECPEPGLRQKVERLLARSSEATAFPALGENLLAGLEKELAPAELAAGSRLGAYSVVRPIGRGGMARVYLAERADGLFEQQVAVKVLDRGAGDPLAIRRFEQERRILAALDHPSIAHILDGGLIEDSRPYLVMELVLGLPIDRHCDERRLSIPERLRLFATVGRAVAAAHRLLVVHRDIKPGNILVNNEGVPKLLDFGIAKLMAPQEDDSPAAGLTRAATWLMTPEYASPEQWQGKPVSTVSDVYQLGLLLYELLVGERPWRHDAGSRLTPAELAQAATREPPRPSTAVPRSQASPEIQTRLRQRGNLGLADWRRALQGDLDTIVATALQPDPERRYDSALRLVEDIERALAGRPILARPDSLAYRGRKFVARHRWATAASAAGTLLLIGLTAFYAIRLRQERDLARLEAEKSNQVAEFLGGLFKGSNPYETAKASSLTARELLDHGAQRVEAELSTQPEVKAALFQTIAQAYMGIGQPESAWKFADRAVALRTEQLGPLAPGTLQSRTLRMHVSSVLGRYGEALAEGRELAAAYEGTLGPDDGRLGQVLAKIALATARQGGSKEEIAAGLAAGKRGVEILSRQTPSVPLLLGEAHTNYALMLRRVEDFAGAAAENQKAVDTFALVDPSYPLRAAAFSNLTWELSQLGRFEEARQAISEAIRISETRLAPDHPQISLSRLILAGLELDTGHPDQALALLDQALPRFERAVGLVHVISATGRLYRGKALLLLGRPAEALVETKEAASRFLSMFPETSGEVIETRLLEGQILQTLGRNREARELLTWVVATAEAHLPAASSVITQARKSLEQATQTPLSSSPKP